MAAKFEIVDTENPRDRGMRFSSLVRARRELDRAVPRSRFILIDRETREEV